MPSTSHNNRRQRPTRRERRLLRATGKYRQIRQHLGTADDETLLLTQIGELQPVEQGRSIDGGRHITVGLSGRLQVGRLATVSAPWLVDVKSDDVPFTVTEPGLVLIIDRRQFHLAEAALVGKVEPVHRIAYAARLIPRWDNDQELAYGQEPATTPPATVAG